MSYTFTRFTLLFAPSLVLVEEIDLTMLPRVEVTYICDISE